MNDNNICLELQSFIEGERWKYPFSLTLNTELEKDLKITGDDAIEFIIAFGEYFNVDVSDFRVDNYFNNEGVDLIGFIVDLFKKNPQIKKILTLGDLENAIHSKKLLS